MTKATSKQLLPVFDKPMIYYPISTLMLAGVREILIITTPQDQSSFEKLLGDGSDFGVSFSYATQPKPEGLAQALTIGEEFLANETCMLILGDNIFHGVGLGQELSKLNYLHGAHIFTYEVSNPSDYGVLSLTDQGAPASIEEKPQSPKSHLAVTGLYVFDKKAIEISKNVTPSQRGELEITSVIEEYLNQGLLRHTNLSRGTVWLDTGTISSLNNAGEYIRVIQERSGLIVACLEEIAFNNGWITSQKLQAIAQNFKSASYANYLRGLV
jgi:glucose-1-phosphate thymidylyltransferase